MILVKHDVNMSNPLVNEDRRKLKEFPCNPQGQSQCEPWDKIERKTEMTKGKTNCSLKQMTVTTKLLTKIIDNI
jgi:hypothetical protein